MIQLKLCDDYVTKRPLDQNSDLLMNYYEKVSNQPSIEREESKYET